MPDLTLSPYMIPIAGMLMVCIVVAIRSKHRTNARELDAHNALRLKEMEHLQKMKEMELELAKLDAAKSKTGSTVS
jgi:hypothetical protein